MMKTLRLILRARQAQAEDALTAGNALLILDQQIRDAAADLSSARRALALSIAQAGLEEKRLRQVSEHAADLEARGAAALAAGRHDFAEEAAAAIAAIENDAAAATRAQSELIEANSVLKGHVESAERRLAGLQRGRRSAQTTDAVRRLRTNAPGQSHALADAEATLANLRDRQRLSAAADAATTWLAQSAEAPALSQRLEAEGFGPATTQTAAIVLQRLAQRAGINQVGQQ